MARSLIRLLAPLVLVLSLGCGGCGGGGSGKKPFKVATFTFVGYAPLHLAKEKGFFEGIDVDLRMIEDTAARRAALSTGEVHASVDILDSFVIARASGVQASVVFKIDSSTGADGLVVRKEINSIKGLKGRTVAFPKDQPSHFMLLELLAKEGMTMDDIKAKPTSEADQAGSAFVSGSVDAAVTWEPWLTKAAKTKHGKVLATSKDTPGLIVDVFTVRNDFLENDPATVKAFVKGWFKAIELWKSDPKEANRIMAASMKLPQAEFEEMVKGIEYGDEKANREFFKGEAESPFRKLAQKASAVWLREGLIKKPIAPKSIDASSLMLELK
jgi:NitT/TauT family transport system substrate-binding protein